MKDKNINLLKILLYIIATIVIIKCYLLGPGFGLNLVKEISPIYAMPGGTGFGFAILMLMVIVFGNIISVFLLLAITIYAFLNNKGNSINKLILRTILTIFCIHSLLLIICIGNSISIEGFSFVKIINTYIGMFISTIQIYFPFFLFLSVLNIVLIINTIFRTDKEIKHDIDL